MSRLREFAGGPTEGTHFNVMETAPACVIVRSDKAHLEALSDATVQPEPIC
ncbi:protein of unassigned function [Methylobacterium oryzae CBMB20]|uniref:Protein of unassigned function n=1 Tax=Methylobacterium oryzae CBMB20 TaxID=693986 RepID=A0A089P349_9HYPH|nr:protein of unassigned function [Methylobacterium oryzae CBMB20]